MTKLLDIRARQELPAPSTDEEWKFYRAAKDARRAKNVTNAIEVLRRNDVDFNVGTPTENMRLKVRFDVHGDKGEVKYFPETGLWYELGANESDYHFGVRNLVRFLKGEVL